MDRVKFLQNYGKLRDEIDGLIMGNVNVSVREGERELWNCNTGEWKDARFRKFRVVQTFNIETFLGELLPLLDEINDSLK